MKKGILLYATARHVTLLTYWGMGIMTSLLILRAINDFMKVFSDSEVEMTFKDALRKVKNRIYAVVIALTIDSTIIFIKKFYM